MQQKTVLKLTFWTEISIDFNFFQDLYLLQAFQILRETT
jgi:hypothetical protein